MQQQQNIAQSGQSWQKTNNFFSLSRKVQKNREILLCKFNFFYNCSSNNNNNRSSPRSRAPIAEGVYNNSHFLHAAALQVGNNVRVKTKGGVVVEGIFRTFSETFHVSN